MAPQNSYSIKTAKNCKETLMKTDLGKLLNIDLYETKHL